MPRRVPFLDRADQALQSPATRLALSFLIVLSVLPPGSLGLLPAGVAARLDLLFLLIFGPEFALRLSTSVRQWGAGRRNRWEAVLLTTDFVALLSFLPLQDAFPDTAYFRLFRLTRLVLLLGYWGEMASDLARIVFGRERRYQVVAVALFGLVLSFAGAVILAEFAPGYDYDEDGVVTAEDRGFRRVLWWSFRQVQDSGNLAVRPADALVVLVSLALTFAGLILFTFVIGISTGAMQELMHRARDRPVALRAHTVVLGFTASTAYLLHELADIYRKNLKQVKGAVLGPADEAPDALFDRRLRGYQYRSGNPERAADLERVGIAEAKRVLVLGEGTEPDARVIAALLATRALTRRATLYADLEHEKNFVAARGAGGPRTRMVGSGPFLGDYLAQNLAYPGIYHVYRQLLTSRGCEIYTYLWSDAERRALGGVGALDPSALAYHAGRAHAVRWLGFLTAPSPDATLEVDDFDVLLNPAAARVRDRAAYAFDDAGRVRPGVLRGVVGIAARFESVRSLGEALARGEEPKPEPTAPAIELSLSLPMGRPHRLLLCATGAQVPRVVSELMRYTPGLAVTVLTRDAGRVEGLVSAIAGAVENARSWMPDRRSDCRVRVAEDGSLRVDAASGEVGSVRVVTLDWTDLARIQRDPQLRLSETEAVAFLPRGDDESADGLVALDCLRLADLLARGALEVPASFHVLGLLRDPVKTDRLSGRVAELTSDREGRRFTILSSERARHQFLVQNLFVPGLNTVLLEILGASGQHLCRLVPRSTPGPRGGNVDALAVQAAVAARDLLFIGLEKTGVDGVEVLIDPRELAPDRAVAWGSVTALYALADQSTVERATAS
jgi:hypothetical protein